MEIFPLDFSISHASNPEEIFTISTIHQFIALKLLEKFSFYEQEMKETIFWLFSKINNRKLEIYIIGIIFYSNYAPISENYIAMAT